MLKKLRQINLKEMLNYHCPKGGQHLPSSGAEVLSLLRAVLHRIGASEVVAVPGTSVARALTRLLQLTKGGHLTLSELLHCLPPTRAMVPWLTACSKGMKTHLGARLATWVLVVLPKTLLAALFTTTDSSAGKRHLLFYRQSVWQALTSRALQDLVARGHNRTLPDAFLKPREPGKPPRPPPPVIRPMRFIPKSNLSKVRPISMRRTQGTSAEHDAGLARDSALRKLVRKLVTLLPATCDLKGARLAREWQRVCRAAPPGTPLYWATADITDAFGSVLHRKLTSIVTSLAKQLECYADSRRLANEVCYRVVRHIVAFRVGGKVRYYHLAGRGLVQGDPLSPDLSSIYYGHLTSTALAPFLRPPTGHTELLLRAADDFLFLSTSRDRVWQFQRATIGATFPEYGARFAKEKWASNVESGDQRAPALFCGALLRMDTRAVAPHHVPDISPLAAIRPRAEGEKARVTVANKFAGIPGKRQSGLCSVHMTELYLGRHNPPATVLATLAANLAVALRRLTALLDLLIWAQGRRVEEGWLWRQVLMPAFLKVQGTMRRTGLPRTDVRLLCLLSLRAAVAACPTYSPQLRKGVANSVNRARARVALTTDRTITTLVQQAVRMK